MTEPQVTSIPKEATVHGRVASRASSTLLAVVLAASLTSCSRKSSPTAPGPVTITISTKAPLPNATNVSVTSTFSATFSAAVNAATVTSSSFSVRQGSTTVRGRIGIVGNVVTFTPLVPLFTSAQYTVTATTAIQDANGHALASNVTWDVSTQAGTALGGIVSSNTTLTLASSPYVLTSDVQVAFGTTLTIDPGVVVDAQGFKISVFGSLSAVGTAGSRIAFLGARILPGANTSPQPYTITIQHAIVAGGQVYAATGSAIYGSLVLRDSRLYDLADYLYVWYPVADCYVERNVFIHCGGISAGVSGGTKVFVRNNDFYQQTTGYAVEDWNAGVTADVVVTLNSFLSTDRIALQLPAGFSSAHMTGTNNYWGTTSTATIDAMIFDKNDDLSSNDVIVYTPILTVPDAATPDPTPWIP